LNSWWNVIQTPVYLSDTFLDGRGRTQGDDLEALQRNLRVVIEMLLQDGEPKLESEFVGVQRIQVA